VSGSASDWRPGAGLDTLAVRARALAAARAFFATRGVLEVETPQLVAVPVSDPQLAHVPCQLAVRPGQPYWLHTSPEYHMKRLLAAGAPDIYQLAKVFRDGELGARHLPEFTLVEWYRRGVDFGAFIDEALDFVRTVAASVNRALGPAQVITYRELFLEVARFDPLSLDGAAVRAAAARCLAQQLAPAAVASLGDDTDAWLDAVMVTVVEPALVDRGLVAVRHYPASQAALAQLEPQDSRVARRFEIYLGGCELANGFHELADAGEQRRRFAADRARRQRAGLIDTPPDEALLAALAAGLPDCCGVAIGFDRLLMASLGRDDIREVVAFAAPEPD
jgi:lysyl-tRNA synthetase class 2